MINSVRARMGAVIESAMAPGAVLATGFAAASELADTVRNARTSIKASAAGAERLAPALRALGRIEAKLRRPLRVALLGEFNSGKSTFANLFVANSPLPTFQLSNTRIPTLLHYAAKPEVRAISSGGLSRALTTAALEVPADTIRFHVGLPLQPLRACEILDFPGFADPWLAYGALDIGRHPIDAAIWCTFSTQAWKESESTAWRLLPARLRTNGMLAITSADLLAQDQRAKVMARVQRVAGADFSDIRMVSARQGRRALDDRGEIADPELWHESGAEDICNGLQRLLSTLRRHRLEKAKMLTSRIAGSALRYLEA